MCRARSPIRARAGREKAGGGEAGRQESGGKGAHTFDLMMSARTFAGQACNYVTASAED